MKNKLKGNQEEVLKLCSEGKSIRGVGIETVEFNNLTDLQKELLEECLEGKSIENVGVKKAKANLFELYENEIWWNSNATTLECMKAFPEVERYLNSLGDKEARQKALIGDFYEMCTKFQWNIDSFAGQGSNCKDISTVPKEHVAWDQLGIRYGFTESEVYQVLKHNRETKKLEMLLYSPMEYGRVAYFARFSNVDERGRITLQFIDSNDNKSLIKLEVEYTEDHLDLIQRLISKTYADYINPYSKEVNSLKEFSIRKTESLKRWIQNGNQDKVNKINSDMIEKVDRVEEAKSKKSFYKQFVNRLYSVKGDLEMKIA